MVNVVMFRPIFNGLRLPVTTVWINVIFGCLSARSFVQQRFAREKFAKVVSWILLKRNKKQIKARPGQGGEIKKLVIEGQREFGKRSGVTLGIKDFLFRGKIVGDLVTIVSRVGIPAARRLRKKKKRERKKKNSGKFESVPNVWGQG